MRVEEYTHKNYVQQIQTPYIREGKRSLHVRPTLFADGWDQYRLPCILCNVRALWKLQYNACLIQKVCQTVVSEQQQNDETAASERQRNRYQAENC